MKRTITRRRFVSTAAALASVTIAPRHVLGGAGFVAPSDRVGAALIGCGGRGPGTLNDLERKHGLPIAKLAVCDVDRRRRELMRIDTRKKGHEHCESYNDFRDVLDRRDIDVVAIATPPHWHALISIAAMESGKDVLCEKPMTRFIAEGRAVVEAARRYGRVFQIGTYGRFGKARDANAMRTRKIMKSGLLERCDGVVIKKGGLKIREWRGLVNVEPRPVRDGLDWDLYQGPAPMRPYHGHRHGGSHRGYWDYEGGGLCDMGQHYLDPLTYEYGLDDTAPVEVVAHAPPAHPEVVGVWGWVELKYANGFTLVLDGGEWGEPYDRKQARGVGPGDLSEEGRAKLAKLPDPEPLMGFGEAVRTRGEAGGNPEAAQRTVTILHLANLAIRTGRRIRFDPEREFVIGDEEANRLVNVPMRAPWHL